MSLQGVGQMEQANGNCPQGLVAITLIFVLLNSSDTNNGTGMPNN
jgi:hypothetical protein